MENPLKEKQILPETPEELEEEEFEPKLPEVAKSTRSSTVLQWVSEVSQWDALYALCYTLSSTTGGTLFGLIVARAIDWQNHWFLAVLFIVGLFSAIFVKMLKRREQKQQLEQQEKQKQMLFEEEIHNQTLEFNAKTFNNKLFIEQKRAELQQEIDRNESIDLREHMFSLIEQRPLEGAAPEEFQLYSEQLNLLGKVLETHTLDRAIRYGKYDVIETKTVLDQMQQLTQTVNNLLLKAPITQESTNGRMTKYREALEALKVMNILQEHDDEFGIIEWDENNIIVSINEAQAKFTGIRTYEMMGKDAVKGIEESFPTEQINMLLHAVKRAYEGMIVHLHVENFRLLEGNNIDICIIFVPKYDLETLEVIGIYNITAPIGHDLIDCPHEEFCLDIENHTQNNEEVVLLVGSSFKDDIKYYRDLLNIYGYTILSCKSITEAIRIMNNQLIHVALIDIIFQDGNADEIVKEMIKKYPNIQIVVIASYENPSIKAKLKVIDNVTVYKEKPIRPQDIVLSVQLAVSKALIKKVSMERSKNIPQKERRIENGNGVNKKVNLANPE